MPPPLVRTVRSLAHDLTSRLPTESPFHPRQQQSPTTPTGTISFASTVTRLFPRLATGVSTVPQGYGAPSGPEPGVVVGIVLGSIAGFLLLLWLIYTCVNLSNSRKTNTIVETEGSMVSSSVMTRKSRKHRRSRQHHSRSRSVGRRETVEIREQRVMPERVVPERIIVEERRSRGPPPPRMSGPPPPPPPMSDEDDEVVVIEENTPPRRRESRRHRRRSSERRSSGYRDVDPYRYAGGDEPMRSMSRRRSDSRRRYS
ncbi:hypothetical protein PG985_004163 [Apiospora marii]|uniref:Uncharacterized protein n=1 Tax=Apiospora marii TaxID=335849 RepID=A0ABR1S8I0_9PEZI